jgi:hypothetical protein
MLTETDLQRAVAAGVLDAKTAGALIDFARKPAPGMAAAAGETADAYIAATDDERFRFLNGFNDVFLTIGVVLIGLALPLGSLLFLAPFVLWGLSEVLVRRMRAVLPGIALAILFTQSAALLMLTLFAAVTGMEDTATSYGGLGTPLSKTNVAAIVYAAFGLVASGLFYARFRLPFALALIAVYAVFALVYSVSRVFGIPMSGTLTVLVFACGLVTFGLAMAFDLKDRLRQTRLSDCAFWLHLVAAPMIVHPVVSGFSGLGGDPAASAALVIATTLILGLVALAIDRRAVLVSSLAYFGTAIYRLIGEQAAVESWAVTLAAVGAFVLVLGIFWHPLRSRLVAALQSTPLGPYLTVTTP